MIFLKLFYSFKCKHVKHIDPGLALFPISTFLFPKTPSRSFFVPDGVNVVPVGKSRPWGVGGRTRGLHSSCTFVRSHSRSVNLSRVTLRRTHCRDVIMNYPLSSICQGFWFTITGILYLHLTQVKYDKIGLTKVTWITPLFPDYLD